MPTETLLEEIRKVILSLLVARPDFTPLPVLDHDYYEAEGKRIPWRKFGFVSLLDFLQSMPQYFQFTNLNGVNCIRGIADKSKHVSSLVARQKKMSKYPSRSLRSSYHPHISRFRPKIPAEKLNDLIQYVKNSSNGVSINSALLFIQNQLPYVTLSVQDLQDQLRELGHQLYLDGDIIRSVTRNAAAPQSNTFRHCQSPSAASEPPVNIPELSNSNIVYTVPEECNDIILDTNEDGFVRLNSAHCSRQSKTDERLMSSLLQYSNYGETVNYYNHHDNHEERYDNVDNAKYMDLNISNNEPDNLASLISHRMQSRLKQLVQKYPDGIFCSELPNLYMKEFKMPLNYNELGFNSVCTFASYLPDIFYLTRLDTNDDFVVYSADKRPKEQDMLENDDQEISKSSVQKTTYKTKPIDTPNLQLDLCDMNDNNTPFPLDLSPDVLDKFAPNDVTTLNNIKHILVTDLQQDKKQYLEVYIAEVFTPSFFCIHLRKNVKYFETFMDNLHNFYEQNQERYAIPKLGLKRGLNCACVYNGLWHRAVIKTVKPDFRVTVMFYDYGTQKTYLSEDVFYLAKQFSDLPAQAIPCGLYNIKPYVGDRWKKSITDRFIDRICETLLAATVVSVDPPNNSMLINLTDTSEEKDVCINDWLVQENLARHGKMGDSVDMASATKYVLNSAGRMPSYCFAEENPVTDSYNKSTTTKKLEVSSGPSFVCCDNNQQQRSIPPSFAPLNEHSDRFNTQASRHYLYSVVDNMISKMSPLFSDQTEDVANSPFPDRNSKPSMANVTSDILSNDIEKQIFAQFMQDNTTLQMQLTESFRGLLKFPPETKNTCLNYITLLFQFNNILRLLVKELNNRLASIIPDQSRNNENDTGLSSKMSHHSSNCESFVNQEVTNNSSKLSPLSSSLSTPRPPPLTTMTTSSPTENSLGEHHKQCHYPAFLTSDMKGFPYSSQHPVHAHNPYNLQLRVHAPNFDQAANQIVVSPHQADVNGSFIQSPSITFSDSESSMLNKHVDVAKDTSVLGNISSTKMPSLFNDSKKDVTNTFLATSSDILPNDVEKQTFSQLMEKLLHKSALDTTTASHDDTSNINLSNYRHNTNEFVNARLQHGNTYKNEEATKHKETNPFLIYEDTEEKILTEQCAYNIYDMTNLASHLSNTSQQSYTPMMNENANSRATNCNFYGTYGNTVRNESNDDLMSTGYGMCGDVKVNSDNNNAPRMVYEAGPVMYNLQKKPEDQLSSSQSVTQSQNNIVNNDVNHVAHSSSSMDISNLNGEGYVTSSIQAYNLPSMTSTENRYQPNVNTNVLPHRVSPETWTNSMMLSNDLLQNYSKNSVPVTMRPSTDLSSHKEWNPEIKKEFTAADSYRTTKPSYESLSDDSEMAMMAMCINFWNSSLNKNQKELASCNTHCNTSLNIYFLFQQVDCVDGITILFHMDGDGWILIDEFVEAFTKCNKSCSLKALLETTNILIPLKEIHRFEYPVQFLQLDSYPLNVVRDSKNRITSLNLISLQASLRLLYRLKLLSYEEIKNSFKENKMFTNNPIMFNIWELIITYKDFRHRIEQCNANYRI